MATVGVKGLISQANKDELHNSVSREILMLVVM